VPERTVNLFPAAAEKTTKLYILDVKPRSPAVKESEVLSCYGIEGGQRMLPEEFGANGLRQKFAKRPGRLSNANVAQPEADMDVMVGADNPYLMPTVVYQSVRDGKDLFITRNVLHAGEMLTGETSGTAWKRTEAAGSAKKKASTPKPRQQKASKRPVKAAPVPTPAADSRRPEEAEEQLAAGPSGVRSSRRVDSSPALSVAASDTMVSSVERAASSPPVRGGSREKSSSEEPPLPCARKSRPRLESSASETSAASPGRVAHGDGSSVSRAATVEMRAKDSGDSSGSEAGSRGRSRDSSASSSRAAGTRSGAGDSSADEEDDGGSEEEDRKQEEERQKLDAVEKKAADSLRGLIQAREKLKEAARDVQQEIARQLVSKEKKEELRKIAAARVEKQAAKKRAAEAAAAKEEEAKRELEADRQRVEQEEQRVEQEEQKQEEQREEKRRREQKETKRRLEEDRRARKRSEDDREARRRSEDDREARRRSEDFRGTEERPGAGRAEAERAEDGKEEASWGGRCVRDRKIQERLGKREERPGRSSGPEGAGLEPGYSIPRRHQPWETTASPSRSLPSSYKDYAIALPRSEEERLVFQQLLDKKMLFRDPGTGPDRCKQPHFRFRAGEPIRGSEGADRRRSRSPEKQEAARKRHRNLKN
jgi:hypothetical protein